MHKFVNQHPFLTFVFFTIILPALLGTAIGCGGDTACEGDACGPGPTDDAGTSGDPITKEDGGTPDSGDITTGDGGDKPDAGKDPCDEYQWVAGDYDCQGRTAYQSTCTIWAEEDVCYGRCTDMFNKMSVDDARLTLNAPNSLVYKGNGYVGTCTKK